MILKIRKVKYIQNADFKFSFIAKITVKKEVYSWLPIPEVH